MNKQVGLWIDHRQAVIVTIVEREVEIKRITSNIEKHVRYSGKDTPTTRTQSGGDSAEDIRDRRFDNHLDQYYDEVISYLRDASSILLLGPGEAKGELHKRLTDQHLDGQVVGIETKDKMTDVQIALEVQQYFQKAS
ncbi:MAG: hypothetical protein JNM70_19535 [Anaerolineae bacterium]|nr:hypothetical protein [Anaerolineae bacterium]